MSSHYIYLYIVFIVFDMIFIIDALYDEKYLKTVIPG